MKKKLVGKKKFLFIKVLQTISEEGMTELEYHYFGTSITVSTEQLSMTAKITDG